MDLIIRHARLRNQPGTWDIGVIGDHISAIAEHLEETASVEVDAAGNLVTPTYVNGHIHLAKCHLREKMQPNKNYSFAECLELTWEHKADLNVLAAPTVRELLRLQQPAGWVVRDGKVLVRNQMQGDLVNQ